MKKRVLSLALALVLALGLMVPALAISDKTEQYMEGFRNAGQYPIYGGAYSILVFDNAELDDRSNERFDILNIQPGGNWGFSIDIEIAMLLPNNIDDYRLWGFHVCMATYDAETGKWIEGEQLDLTQLDRYAGPYMSVDALFELADKAEGDAIAVYTDTKPTILHLVGTELNIPDLNVACASTQNVLVDGKSVEFECYALKDASGNDTNYIKLRDVASVLNGTAAQFNVGWDGNVNIETGKAYAANGTEMSTPYSGNRTYENATAATNINGKAADLSAIVLKDDAGNGYTYYKLRDLGSALGFTVDWSAEKGIFIETK